MKIILILVSFLCLYFKAPLPVFATFNSTAAYHSLSFSIAEQNPPQSEIEELPFQVTNQSSVPITVKALDDSGLQKFFYITLLILDPGFFLMKPSPTNISLIFQHLKVMVYILFVP